MRRLVKKKQSDLIGPDLPIPPEYGGPPKEEIDVGEIISRIIKLPKDEAKIEIAKLSNEELWALYNKLKGKHD